MGKRIVQFFLSLIATVIGAIPILMFLGARSLLSPEGFLQNFFVLGVGFSFLGGLQALFCFLWVFALMGIWCEE